jgi:glycosyltransferase involved in cell wall biosynthesis
VKKRHLLLVSFIEPWSLASGVGAPSLYETLKGYVEAGWKITFVTSEKRRLQGGGHEQNIDTGLPSIEVIRFSIPVIQDIVGARLQAKLERVLLFRRGARQVLADLLGERQFDLVYAYEEAAVAAVSSLAKQPGFNTPTLHRFQGTILGARYTDWLHCLRKYETWSALRARADLYVMTNDGTFGDRALKYWNNDVNDSNLMFVRNGIDTTFSHVSIARSAVLAEYGLPAEGLYLLTVSRLTRWKRVDRAMRAVGALTDKWPGLQLIVCGDGEARAQLEDLAGSLGLRDRVHFVGAQPRPRVAELINSCDIFLSLYDISNCGNPLFEAMLCGRSLITLDNGTTGDVIRDGVNGRLLEVTDDEAEMDARISAAIDSLLEDRDRRESLGSGASDWARQNLKSWQERMHDELKWVEAHINSGPEA